MIATKSFVSRRCSKHGHRSGDKSDSQKRRLQQYTTVVLLYVDTFPGKYLSTASVALLTELVYFNVIYKVCPLKSNMAACQIKVGLTDHRRFVEKVTR